jgi:hypothetical protein
MKTIDYYKIKYDNYDFYKLSDENRQTIINELISQEFVDKLLDIAQTLGYEVKQQSLTEHIFNYEENKLSFLHCLHQALGLKGFRDRKTPKQIRSLWVDNCHLDCLFAFYHEYKRL